MRRMSLVALCIGLASFGVFNAPGKSMAGVQVNIGLSLPFPEVLVAAPPRAVILPQPPRLVAIPRTDVYYAPDADRDVFFHRGSWYRPKGDRWYRASGYDGPWVYVGPSLVPGVLITLPRDSYYRGYYEDHGHRHDRYDRHRHKHKHKKHWKKWRERERCDD